MKIKNLFLAILIVGVLYFLTSLLFVPAYISTIANCYPERFEKQYSDDYYTAGQVSLYENGTIEVYISDNENLPLIMHERTHIKQIQEERVGSCRFPLTIYINELEAYSVQRYWEFKGLF